MEKGNLELKKCDGYIYVEMLVALFICLFIVFSLYPIIDQVKQDRKNILIRTEANHLLYEKLTALLDGSIDWI